MKSLALLLALTTAPAMADTVIAARTIRAQTLLTVGDVQLAKGDVAGAYGALEAVIGQEARVALYAGRPIRSNEVGPPALIDRNQIVILLYRQGGLRMAAEGRALGRAGAGDRLKVMNLASRQTISGIVRKDGTVTVGGGVTIPLDFPSN